MTVQAGWSDAIDLIPWRMYLRYNNPEILAENYEKVKNWLSYCLERAKRTILEEKKGKTKSIVLICWIQAGIGENGSNRTGTDL